MRKKDIRAIISIFVLLVAAFQIVFGLVGTDSPKSSPVKNDGSSSAVLGENASTSSAQVIRVVDGDTIRVALNGEEKTVRLIGINTPESVDPRREVQCFGKEASNKAKELLTGKIVTLESDASQGDKDKYQRLLRYVWVDGANVNKYMISEGYAYEYTYDLPYKYQDEFKQAQQDAQKAKRGLWSDDTCGGEK